MGTFRKMLANDHGMVLMMTVMIMALLIAAGVGALVSTQRDLKISGNFKTSTQAFYLAETGLERALGKLNTVTNWIGGLADPTTNAFPGDNSLGKGTYVVQVLEDDPAPGYVRIRSTGHVARSVSTIDGVAARKPFPIFDGFASFSCGNLSLKEGFNNLISGGNVFVDGNIDLQSSGTHQIQNGDALAVGNINVNGTSSIIGGNAFANGNVDLTSSASPNIEGNATASGTISGSGTVTGTKTPNASPLPVTNLCFGTELAKIVVTSDVIQGFRDSADTTISGDYQPGSTITLTGIVHITGNFRLTGNVTYSANVIFIVDGNGEVVGPGSLRSNPPGSTATFFVPAGNFEVKGGGSVTLDGILHVGTVDQNGSGLSGGSIDVKDGADLTVNGMAIATNGNIDASAGGAFTVNYQPLTDGKLTNSGSYTLKRWHEVRS